MTGPADISSSSSSLPSRSMKVPIGSSEFVFPSEIRKKYYHQQIDLKKAFSVTCRLIYQKRKKRKEKGK